MTQGQRKARRTVTFPAPAKKSNLVDEHTSTAGMGECVILKYISPAL